VHSSRRRQQQQTELRIRKSKLVADQRSRGREIATVDIVDERRQRQQRDDPRADAPSDPPDRVAFTLPEAEPASYRRDRYALGLIELLTIV
jgi:hypothetical protein